MNPLRRRTATILVAEDDPVYAEALCDLLRVEGYAVEHVSDGQQAIDEILRLGERLDLVLCDLLLPRKTGFEVVREMVESDVSVPVLAMTGVYRDFREIHALRGLGVAGYLSKASPFEHLLFRVNDLLFPSRDNQRGNHRVAVAVPVQFRLGQHVCYGASYNLSITGVYVRTSEPVLAGATTELAIALPTAREMVCSDAEIVHSATPAEVRGTAYPAGFGARFLDPPPLTATAIRHFVAAVQAEESGGLPIDQALANLDERGLLAEAHDEAPAREEERESHEVEPEPVGAAD